jgi:hypothetical protein
MIGGKKHGLNIPYVFCIDKNMSTLLSPRTLVKTLFQTTGQSPQSSGSEIEAPIQETFYDDRINTKDCTVFSVDAGKMSEYLNNVALHEPHRLHFDGPVNPAFHFGLQQNFLTYASKSVLTVQFDDTLINCIACVRTSKVSYVDMIYLWLPKTTESMDILKRFFHEACTYVPPVSLLGSNEIYHKFSHAGKEWNTFVGKLQVRSLDRLYFNATTTSSIDTLVRKLDRFQSPGEQQRYHEHCRNYKFTCLITGPPQSGKNCLVKALAHKYKRTLYTLFIGSATTRAELQNLMNTILKPSESVLLIDNIDTKFTNITPAALLDTLRNLTNRLWVFMTCNKPNVLQTDFVAEFCSNTILDFHLHFNAYKKQQVEKMFTELVSGDCLDQFEQFWKDINNKELTFGEITSYLFDHFDDPCNAEALGRLTAHKSSSQKLYL